MWPGRQVHTAAAAAAAERVVAGMNLCHAASVRLFRAISNAQRNAEGNVLAKGIQATLHSKTTRMFACVSSFGDDSTLELPNANERRICKRIAVKRRVACSVLAEYA